GRGLLGPSAGEADELGELEKLRDLIADLGRHTVPRHENLAELGPRIRAGADPEGVVDPVKNLAAELLVGLADVVPGRALGDFPRFLAKRVPAPGLLAAPGLRALGPALPDAIQKVACHQENENAEDDSTDPVEPAPDRDSPNRLGHDRGRILQSL